MATTARVPHPERWWLATRDDLPWLTDPDKDDRRVRHSDRNQRQWGAIADVVQTAAHAMANGRYGLDEEDPTVAHVPIDVAGLDPKDQKIEARAAYGGSAVHRRMCNSVTPITSVTLATLKKILKIVFVHIWHTGPDGCYGFAHRGGSLVRGIRSDAVTDSGNSSTLPQRPINRATWSRHSYEGF